MRLILLAGVALIAFFVQEPSAPEGTARSCNNYHATTDKCKCHRATTCARQRPAGEDPKCKTYCKPANCHCIDPCAS